MGTARWHQVAREGNNIGNGSGCDNEWGIPWLVQDADGRWVSTRQWHLRVRLSDGSIELLPLVLSEVRHEGDGSWRYYGPGIYFTADISHDERLQCDIREARKTMFRHGLIGRREAECGVLERPVTEVIVHLLRQWTTSAGGRVWWAHLSASHTSKWLVLFRPTDDSASDIDVTMEGLGIIDGRLLAIMPQLLSWTWRDPGASYEWSPEVQDWINIDDERPWWLPPDEYNQTIMRWDDMSFSYDFDAWETEGEYEPTSPNSQAPLFAERYADYEDAYENVVRDGKKATSSAIGRIGERHPRKPDKKESDGN